LAADAIDNTVVVMDLKGADIKALLERSCLKEGESDANGASKGQLQLPASGGLVT